MNKTMLFLGILVVTIAGCTTQEGTNGYNSSCEPPDCVMYPAGVYTLELVVQDPSDAVWEAWYIDNNEGELTAEERIIQYYQREHGVVINAVDIYDSGDHRLYERTDYVFVGGERILVTVSEGGRYERLEPLGWDNLNR